MTEHERISSLAPWYANGTLSPDEREAFERHLECCRECRAEVDFCRELAEAYPASDGPAPHPAQIARLLDRIDAGAAERLPAALDPAPGSIRSLMRSTPRPVRWLVAAQIAFVVLAGAAFLARERHEAPGRSGFRTLSSAPEPRPGDVRIVFAPDADEVEVRRLLLGVRAEIIGGPSPVGAYTLSVQSSPAGAPIGEVLELLRASPLVRLAEPLGGKGEPPG